jgi:hypothetical protein
VCEREWVCVMCVYLQMSVCACACGRGGVCDSKCMSVCECVCVTLEYICVSMNGCVDVYACMCMYAPVYESLWVSEHICTCVLEPCACTCVVYMCVCQCTRPHVLVCVYIPSFPRPLHLLPNTFLLRGFGTRLLLSDPDDVTSAEPL